MEVYDLMNPIEGKLATAPIDGERGLATPWQEPRFGMRGTPWPEPGFDLRGWQKRPLIPCKSLYN